MIKGAHSETTSSNETLALAKSMNMDIWVVVTSNQLCLYKRFLN